MQDTTNATKNSTKTREEVATMHDATKATKKYIPGSPDVRIKPRSLATYLAGPRDRLKSRKTSTRGQKVGPRTQARRSQRHRNKIKAATIGALVQAVADAISAANVDLTVIAIAARTSGELRPAACKGTAVISQHTRAVMIRDDQPTYENSNDPQ